MLKRVFHLIKSCDYHIESNTLYCKGYVISDPDCISYLEQESIIEDTISSKVSGQRIDFAISLIHLNSKGIYQDVSSFIKRNKYTLCQHEFYILQMEDFHSKHTLLVERHKAVLNLIEALNKNFKHTYSYLNNEYGVLFNEGRSLILKLDYSACSIDSISQKSLIHIDDIIEVLGNNLTEKKSIFLNELIEFISNVKDDERFETLITKITEFYDKANNAYRYYLRDFSYNKLKLEIDSKALEFAQKIQGVINDAQTKLIAIPTAFVLAVSAINYESLNDSKNYAIVISLFIFSLIIQLFLSNQKSILAFIGLSISEYKETFTQNQVKLVDTNFWKAEQELKKQGNRLTVVEITVWAIPICLTILLVTLYLFRNLPVDLSILRKVITAVIHTII